jgi:DNA repair protein RecO (recombination protein O)
VYRTEGIVLKGYDFGEADRILTLYTPQLGKLRAVAKGMRRTKSRMGGHLDLFTRSNLLVARGRQLDIVTQAETIESFASMRTDLLRALCG